MNENVIILFNLQSNPEIKLHLHQCNPCKLMQEHFPTLFDMKKNLELIQSICFRFMYVDQRKIIHRELAPHGVKCVQRVRETVNSYYYCTEFYSYSGKRTG